MGMNDLEMKGYIKAKTQMAIEELTKAAVYVIKVQESTPSDTLEQAKAQVGYALYDLTKVLAVLTNIEWNRSDSDVILAKGGQGLEEVLYRYGLKSEPEHLKKERLRPQFVSQILELSRGEERSSRTLIYDELSSFGFYDPLAKRILDLIEPVTQGLKSWQQYQQEIEQLLLGHSGNSN